MKTKFAPAMPGVAITLVSSMLLLATPATANEQTTVAAQDEGATRVGTCEDAKAQTKYWCEEREQVTVVSFGMECENAKKNAKEACEGEVSEDQPYQFDKKPAKDDN